MQPQTMLATSWRPSRPGHILSVYIRACRECTSPRTVARNSDREMCILSDLLRGDSHNNIRKEKLGVRSFIKSSEGTNWHRIACSYSHLQECRSSSLAVHGAGSGHAAVTLHLAVVMTTKYIIRCTSWRRVQFCSMQRPIMNVVNSPLSIYKLKARTVIPQRV